MNTVSETHIAFHLSKKVSIGFDAAIEKVSEELKKEGFGIISTLNIKEILKRKINVDFRNYVILGACNPHYAYETLSAEDKMGVFLPCNVVVQEHDNGDVEISIVNPEQLVRGIDDLQVRTFATEVKEAMHNVLGRL